MILVTFDILLQLIEGNFVVLYDQVDLQLLDAKADSDQARSTPNKTIYEIQRLMDQMNIIWDTTKALNPSAWNDLPFTIARTFVSNCFFNRLRLIAVLNPGLGWAKRHTISVSSSQGLTSKVTIDFAAGVQ